MLFSLFLNIYYTQCLTICQEKFYIIFSKVGRASSLVLVLPLLTPNPIGSFLNISILYSLSNHLSRNILRFLEKTLKRAEMSEVQESNLLLPFGVLP